MLNFNLYYGSYYDSFVNFNVLFIDSISAGSPGPKGKEVEPIKPLTSPDSIPSIKEKKIVIYICAADSQGRIYSDVCLKLLYLNKKHVG